MLLFKQLLQNLLNYFLSFSEVNKKYKLKLIFMLSFIFFGLLFIIYKLVLIDQLSISGLDVYIDNNSYSIGENKVLNGLFKTFFGRWNFGPSIEIILICVILGFIFLVSLIILSSYIKIFLISLTFLTGCLFYNLVKIIKNDYNIENIEPIFLKFGLVLTKKVPTSLPSKDVLSLFDSLFLKYNDILLSEHKYIYNLNLSKEQMQTLCLDQNFTNL
jgi:hypothetical protein